MDGLTMIIPEWQIWKLLQHRKKFYWWNICRCFVQKAKIGFFNFIGAASECKWVLEISTAFLNYKTFKSQLLGLLSRIQKIWVTYFDPRKINEMNMRLNMWAQTSFGIRITMNIMRWSQQVLTDTGTYPPKFWMIENSFLSSDPLKTISENCRTTCFLFKNRILDLSPARGATVDLCPITLVFKNTLLNWLHQFPNKVQ